MSLLTIYVQRVQQLLQGAFSSLCKQLDIVHQCQKQEADKLGSRECKMQIEDIEDRVWLYAKLRKQVGKGPI